MKDAAPKCVKCGYLLVGRPAPLRCPECGHAVVRRDRWVEGELHLEGPAVVQPIFMRTLMAALIMTAGFLVGHALNPSLLNWLEIRVQWDPRWSMIPIALAAPLACLLWSRPIDARDSGSFELDSASSWRSGLPMLQLVWLVYALCLVVAIMNTPTSQTARSPTPPDEWMAFTCKLGLAAQLPWILALRHVGRIAEYLREPLLLRTAKLWTWVWAAAVTVGAMLSLVRDRSSAGASTGRLGGNIPTTISSHPSGTSDLERMLTFSNLGLVIGMLLAWMLVWLMAHSLTNAHDTMARDRRREERERDRYITPD